MKKKGNRQDNEVTKDTIILVIVAMSGGVDSAISAYILKRQVIKLKRTSSLYLNILGIRSRGGLYE